MSISYNQYLNETIRSLFEREALDGWIAYTEGSVPLRPHPTVFYSPSMVKGIIFNGFCVQNLAKYLQRNRDKRMGILVKGCDRRAIRVLTQEKQIERNHLFLAGIPCPGMLNRTQLLEQFPKLRDNPLKEEGNHLILQTETPPLELERADYLLPTCRACHHRVPEDVDILLNAPPFSAPDAEEDYKNWVDPIGRMPRDQREALFAEELSRCILCYACRNVCPLCYCETCFTDSLQPVWMTHAPEPENIFFYHVNRMMHMAGRCVACGSCEWACPEHIPLHLLYGKITADVAELFSYEAGLSETIPQPLSHFSEDDPDEHIG